MAYITLNNTSTGSSLDAILTATQIVPGDQPSYELCKEIYVSHVLGGKMADAPISMAQSQQREISVPQAGGDPVEIELKRAFDVEWRALAADRLIANTKGMSRVYGLASVALMPVEGHNPNDPVAFDELYKQPELKFNVFDPLNTSGSLVLNLQPNDPEFLKVPDTISVNGRPYHKSRTVVEMNERPVYLAYTTSGYGYVGRSVYQRALFPLRSFIQSMKTDDLIVYKAGVIVAKMEAAGSVVSGPMQSLFKGKREIVKEAVTGNVISCTPEESIETLNFQNLDAPYTLARSNILKNIATAADMPARLLENETMTSGFGEGTEDANAIAQYIDRVRIDMQPLYDFFDNICMYRAWNPEFYKGIQEQFPEVYGNVPFKAAFIRWRDSFAAIWPNFRTEPESEKAKRDDINLKGLTAVFEVLAPALDPENKAKLAAWLQDNLNQRPDMFPAPLDLDIDAMASYQPPMPEPPEPEPPKPMADAMRGKSVIPRTAMNIPPPPRRNAH
jgi:hypothetical protein